MREEENKEVMKKAALKNWFYKIFIRDVDISKKAIIYLFLSFLSIVLTLEIIIFKYVVFNPDLVYPSEDQLLGILVLIAVCFLISGSTADKVKNKTLFFNIAFLVCISGLFLTIFHGTLVESIGLVIAVIAFTQMTTVWFSTLIHETNILNRGRITAFLIVICVLFSVISIIFAYIEFLYNLFFILGLILLSGVYWASREYKYIETEERLESDEKFINIIFEKHFFRYSTSFTILSFILGDLVAHFGLNIEIVTFSLTTFIYVIIAGCFFDNIGRKISIVLGIFVLSFFLISSGSFFGSDYIFGMPTQIYLSIYYGCSLAPLLLAVFTVSGDFSTERGNLKYRGRINGLFMSLIFVGVLLGFFFSRWINDLYATYPELNNFIPELPTRYIPFVLILLLIWMMAAKETLVSKDSKWANTLKTLFVFSRHGVCLYTHNFEKDISLEEGEQIDEDLVSGVLSGVISIISEITRSKKQLRKIDKEGANLIFTYGKYHITTLIASMELPVLFKKLDEFSREFEHTFDQDLKNFVGNVKTFDQTKFLIEKYFSQKFMRK
ncbi:MAG: hypothetical protein V3V33_15675 [Candidatus Lokiarchaeia archaeon]